ncbi:glycosyltransferase family 4 protein [Providencia manganoxydans]|uniref:Glycosyltransferase family 4 protein n=1 Tax=Providencia manganoxydans TaxID=2923283 RepID=A0ABX7AF74_9GAMM|nr:glycosyltransferase family 4 protein [Providencia manganoxydans]
MIISKTDETNINIAFVVTSLSNKGPIIVIKDIIENLPVNWEITIYYFDDIIEVDFPNHVTLTKITNFRTKIDLSIHDIVHSHLLRADIFCFMNRKSINTHVVTLHSDILKDLRMSHGTFVGSLSGLFWKYILSYADHVVFLTKLQLEQHTNLKHHSVIYNGRPTAPADIRSNDYLLNIKSLNKDCIILGACANVVKRKGFDQIIDLMTRADAQQYLFVLVGDGPELENLKQYSHDKRVSSRCFFIEKTQNVQQYLVLFDIFVMTSHSEGMPLALLEAASCNLPIVCSSLPVINEIFTSNEISFYNYGDIDSLSKSIIFAINNSAMLAKNANYKFRHNYTDLIMSKKYKELYLALKNASYINKN